MKIVICCKEKYRQQITICSMRAVFGLHLVHRKCQISEVSRSFPLTPTRVLPWIHWGAYSASRPQLGKAMTYRHCISCLRHDNHSIPHWFYVKRENLQKIYVNRERPHLFLEIRDSDPPLPPSTNNRYNLYQIFEVFIRQWPQTFYFITKFCWLSLLV